jgi:hypothetical protein
LLAVAVHPVTVVFTTILSLEPPEEVSGGENETEPVTPVHETAPVALTDGVRAKAWVAPSIVQNATTMAIVNE